MRLLFLLAVAAIVPGRLASAQAAPAAWDAFLGCWVASDAEDYRTPTCYLAVPGDPTAVERVGLRDETVVFRGLLRLGDATAVEAEGCTGLESARASADGIRIYLQGRVTCGDRQQETSGLMAMSPFGEMIRAHVVSVGEQRAVVTDRLFLVPVAAVPEVVRARVQASELRARGARIDAARLLDVAQIEDAVANSDGVVVEAWMVEATRDTTPFRAPRRVLERLVAANAPVGVVDMAVMIANPERFDLYATEEVAFVGPVPGMNPWLVNRWYGAGMMPIPELMFWGSSAYLNPWALSGLYPFGGFNPFGIVGMGYWIPGLPGGYGYWRRQLADRTFYVPASGGNVPSTPRLGRVEKGRGYLPNPSRSGGSNGAATPRSPTVRQPAGSGSAVRNSSGGSSGGSSGATRAPTGSSSGTGRTAQPRDPKKP
jgi:hypothetical protein